MALKKQDPDRNVFIMYRDLRSYGFREDLYTEARKMGVAFVRFDPEHPPEVTQDDAGVLTLKVKDHILQRPMEMQPDVLVLASAIIPNENRKLFELVKDQIMVGGVVACADPSKCAVCLTCVRACPYGIPYIGKELGPSPVKMNQAA